LPDCQPRSRPTHCILDKHLARCIEAPPGKQHGFDEMVTRPQLDLVVVVEVGDDGIGGRIFLHA